MPQIHVLPFTTSTAWKTDNGLDPIYRPGEYWLYSRALGSGTNPPGYESGDFWRRRQRSWLKGHVDNKDTSSSQDAPTVAIRESCQDEPSDGEEWRKVFPVYNHKFHRRVVQAKQYSRLAERYPESGIGIVSLSPQKGSQDLPSFDTFWNVNFAAMSARYNLAYAKKDRVGQLFVNDAIARRAFRELQEQPVHARNELEGMRNVWESTSIFAVSEGKLHWWPTIMLWLLHNHPEYAAKFLLASYVEPYPPFYMVADSLEYLASYYFQSSEKHSLVDADYFRAMFYVLLNSCAAAKPSISQKTIFLLATHSTTEQAIYLHSALQTAGITLHHETLLHFAYVYAKEGNFRRALDTLDEAIIHGADPLSDSFLATCNKTLHCSVVHPDGYHASSYIVKRFLALGVDMNQRLYNVLIVNALSANDIPTALRVFKLLEEHKVEVGSFTYSILLNGYKHMADVTTDFEANIVRKAHESAIRCRDSWLATEILHCTYLHQRKTDDGRPRDPIAVLHSIMATYARYFKVRPLKAVGIHDMTTSGQSAQMEPTSAAITIILSAVLNAYPERAHSMLKQFSNIIDFAVEGRQDLRTRGLFPLFRHLIMEDYTYNIFLMALSQDSKNLQHCTALVQKMAKGLPDELLPHNPTTGETIPVAQPTAYTWSILLHAFARHGQTAAAEKVMELMRKRNLKPSEVTWNSLIKGYAVTQDIPGAVDALTRMEGEGFDADVYTTSTLKRIKDGEGLVAAWMKRRDGDEVGEYALTSRPRDNAEAEATGNKEDGTLSKLERGDGLGQDDAFSASPML